MFAMIERGSASLSVTADGSQNTRGKHEKPGGNKNYRIKTPIGKGRCGGYGGRIQR
jgi:hypothetical protein